MNKLSIKICETEKYLYFLKCYKFWSIYDDINLTEIHWHFVHAHDKFQELHLYDKELVLDSFNIKLVLSESVYDKS